MDDVLHNIKGCEEKDQKEVNDPYIVCLVPTRGDRPKMLKRCIEMMSSQTLQPVEVFLMDDPPVDPARKDITWRYRTGIQRIIERHPEVELILFIEDDDWYSSAYVEVFYNAWKQAGSPDIFGIGETYYYHVGLRKFYHQRHQERASAFSTGVTKAAMYIDWPKDDYSFIDLEMWKQLKGQTFVASPPVSIGMKGHKEGAFFGGIGHNDQWNGYRNIDRGLEWISSVLDRGSLHFYFDKEEGPVGTFDGLGPKK